MSDVIHKLLQPKFCRDDNKRNMVIWQSSCPSHPYDHNVLLSCYSVAVASSICHYATGHLGWDAVWQVVCVPLDNDELCSITVMSWDHGCCGRLSILGDPHSQDGCTLESKGNSAQLNSGQRVGHVMSVSQHSGTPLGATTLGHIFMAHLAHSRGGLKWMTI